MKKAVIKTGSKQYLVSEKDIVEVELIKDQDAEVGKKVSLSTLLVVDGDKIDIGQPELKTKVEAEVIDPDKLADKVVSIRYKAKKRVKTVHGHRQHQTILRITKI